MTDWNYEDMPLALDPFSGKAQGQRKPGGGWEHGETGSVEHAEEFGTACLFCWEARESCWIPATATENQLLGQTHGK